MVHTMFEFRRSETFMRWLVSLRDRRAYVRITIRLARLQHGQFGDVKYFDGIGELRIDHGPNLR